MPEDPSAPDRRSDGGLRSAPSAAVWASGDAWRLGLQRCRAVGEQASTVNSWRGRAVPPYLFSNYGLSTQALIETIWSALGQPGPVPGAPAATAESGEYSPV